MSKMCGGIDIMCDICTGHWENGGGEVTMRGARRVLRAGGWSTTRRDGKVIDVCPRCQLKPKASKP